LKKIPNWLKTRYPDIPVWRIMFGGGVISDVVRATLRQTSKMLYGLRCGTFQNIERKLLFRDFSI
jgi:hypothetical protein